LARIQINSAWRDIVKKMKSVELRRHAEKDPNGLLTDDGAQQSRQLGEALGKFTKVYSSDSDRAKLTARLIAGTEALVDTRANMWMASPEKSIAINDLANRHNILFLEAIQQYNDAEVIEGTNAQANKLNSLINQLFDELSRDERGLIVSHDLSINAAMLQRGVPIAAIAPLNGYIIYDDGSIKDLNN
jgi:broad specificity phosphatase PhoE